MKYISFEIRINLFLSKSDIIMLREPDMNDGGIFDMELQKKEDTRKK